MAAALLAEHIMKYDIPRVLCSAHKNLFFPFVIIEIIEFFIILSLYLVHPISGA